MDASIIMKTEVSFLSKLSCTLIGLTLFRMGERGKKSPNPTSFSPVTSTKAGISPQTFLTFSFNPFATLV